MKKSAFLFILFIISITTFAQYKKASFFNKPGRFYEAGLSVLNFSNTVKPAIGILFNVGKLNNNGKYAITSELGIYNKTSFTLNTTDNLGNDIVFIGKTAPLLTYNYSVAYNILGKLDEGERKINPYINVGILGIIKIGEEKVTSGSTYFFEDAPGFGAFIKAGAGAVFSINSKFGVKLEGNYNYFVKTSPEQITKNALYNKSNINFNVCLRYSFGDREDD